MPGERRLNRHCRRLAVADFADHDHIRVLPQNAAQAAGEGHTLPVAHLRLADAFEVIFDRVLDGEDVVLLAVELL